MFGREGGSDGGKVKGKGWKEKEKEKKKKRNHVIEGLTL